MRLVEDPARLPTQATLMRLAQTLAQAHRKLHGEDEQSTDGPKYSGPTRHLPAALVISGRYEQSTRSSNGKIG